MEMLLQRIQLFAMRYIILMFICCITEPLFSQQNTSEKTTTTNINYFEDTSNTPAIANEKTGTYLVKITEGNNTLFTKRFNQHILRQIDKNWFIVSATKKELSAFTQISTIKKANNNWKLSANLKTNATKNGNYFIKIHPADSLDFENWLAQHKASANILSRYPSLQLYEIKTSAAFVKEQLLPNAFVVFIDSKPNKAVEETSINDYDNSVNATNLFFAKYPSINGAGLTTSVKENLFDSIDIDFSGRYLHTNFAGSQQTTHASIMATLIGGGGNSFFSGKGVAWGCRLSSASFTNLLPESNASYQQYNISVQNHSYGVGVENFYGADAAAYDKSMLDNPTLLHIFSAGNSGSARPTDGNYAGLAGFANLTGSFKMAKNIITVGSVDSFYQVPVLSSKGPAYDGRIKPELVAYGNDGSSGAAAITSGVALAVQSAYASLHNQALPENALVKAILINSADDILTPGPDFYSGYGNVNTYKAVKDILSGNIFNGRISQNEVNNHSISIPSNAINLKITLVWNDTVANTNAFTALVNDVDISLEQNSNQQINYPWVLKSDALTDSLLLPAKNGIDSLNTVEQIYVANPLPGDYTIHVKGTNIITNPQAYYIVYRWDTANTFEFISPAKEDHFTSGSAAIFRWQSNYNAGTTGVLEYKYTGSNNWQTIDAAVNLTQPYYKWNTPDTFALVTARCIIGSSIYVSDTFNFSRQLYPKIGFSCSDSLMIYWEAIKGISQYEVLKLGNTYLLEAALTNDTSIILPVNYLQNKYVAVRPVFSAGHTGVNSYTFDYSTQGIGCYISNFLADLNSSNNASLQLSLGTVVNINHIAFEELGLNGWVNIATLTQVTQLNNSFEDNTLHNGINTYRAVVTLNNGTVLYSNTATVYYFGNNTIVLFPNPVPQNGKLVVLSNNFLANALTIYDMMGKKVLQETISNLRQDIPIHRLAKGMYIVQITRNDTILYNGKLLIQ